jgi:8-amino-3,8-dideoxy-alpha-D-manno-octulosonate transaminase
MKRRQFLAAGAAAAAMPAPADEVARPIRSETWGPSYFDEDERTQLADVLESRNPFRFYAKDSKVAAFEREYAARMGTKYALAVSSGTAALQCALAGVGVGPGDEVILPAWTWHSCFNTIVLAGALPVFADIDETLNIDPADFERKITPQTKLVMAVHLLGAPCQIDKVVEIARARKIKVLEDSAQSVGASFKGRPTGSIGDVGIYSLQQNKTITAGEGGAVVSNDPVIFERAARFHDIGTLRPYHKNMLTEERAAAFIGGNFRMAEFAGGVLLAQLRKLDKIIKDARRNAGRLYAAIGDLPEIEFRRQPDAAGELGAYPSFAFADTDRRNRFLAEMKAQGLPAVAPSGSVVLPLEPHIMAKSTAHPAWPTFNTPRGREIQYGPECCKKTVEILSRFAGIPMDPKWSPAQVDAIAQGVRKAWTTTQTRL